MHIFTSSLVTVRCECWLSTFADLLLLGGHCQKQNRAAWRRRQLRERARDLDERRASERIVLSAVEDPLVPPAKMIPVGRVHDVLVFPDRIGAFELRDNVL